MKDLIKTFASSSILKVALFGLVLTVAYYFTYYDDGTSIRNQIQGVQGQIAQQKAKRAEIEVIMKKEEEMRGNVELLARNLGLVKEQIPVEFKDTQMSAIINDAAASSKLNVLELNSITQSSALAPRVAVGSGSEVKPEDLVEEVRFNVMLQGRYEAFIVFLDLLAKQEKIIKIKNFTLEKKYTDKNQIDDDSVVFKGEIIGFKQSVIAIASSLDSTKAAGR